MGRRAGKEEDENGEESDGLEWEQQVGAVGQMGQDIGV